MNRSGYTKRESGACPDCHYRGPRRLCACQAKLGKHLEDGDLEAAREQYEWMRQRAQADLEARTVWE